jgi:acylphosphatase
MLFVVYLISVEKEEKMKCIRMVLLLPEKPKLDAELIQKLARKAEVEGVVQRSGPAHLRVIACGDVERIDAFVDMIHKEAARHDVEEIELESFLKDRDFRGVFRIIE